MTVTDGYNHPSVTAEDIKQRVDELTDQDVAMHAIGRTHMTRYACFLNNSSVLTLGSVL